MYYLKEKIQSDLESLETKEFYIKYIVRHENWYFEKILNAPEECVGVYSDDFRLIVSDNFGISFNNVLMVGSAKVGCSLAPHKYLKDFDRINSDIDTVIISEKLFNLYWEILRNSYRPIYKGIYDTIIRGIYRGFINEKHIDAVEGCRKEWRDNAKNAKNTLGTKMGICNAINFRIYRSWEDFEDYNLSSINNLKNSITRG